MPSITLDRSTIHYTERGTGDKCIFLAHGFPVDSRLWDRVLATPPIGVRVIAPDLPAFGKSTSAPPFTIDSLADDLHLVFFCGFSIWNYLTTPFLLARPDVTVEELSPWKENDQTWRRLRALFPPDIVTSSPEQIFYFDENSLQRRADHDLLGTRVAHYSWAHQAFCDIVVPTLRRSLAVRPDGTAAPTPILLDVEVFEATFD